MTPLMLRLKSIAVGTPIEAPARKLRDLLGVVQRLKHPELWEIYLEERRLPQVLKRILTKNSCGIDVGCHIGSFLTLLVSIAPKGQHVAFEPSRTRSAWLTKFPHVVIHPLAVSEQTGVASFKDNSDRPGYSRLLGPSEVPVSGLASNNLMAYQVETHRLDDLMPGIRRLDLLKLDIEGGELSALRGAEQVIKRFCPSIIFECGSEYSLAEQKLSRRELYEFILISLDYRIYSFTDFLFDKGPMEFDEFRKCGLYPFRAFNFVALPHHRGQRDQRSLEAVAPASTGTALEPKITWLVRKIR